LDSVVGNDLGAVIQHMVAKPQKLTYMTSSLHSAEIGIPGLAPHHLRRTCAKLRPAAGGEHE
jgi:hypothetical protein